MYIIIGVQVHYLWYTLSLVYMYNMIGVQVHYHWYTLSLVYMYINIGVHVHYHLCTGTLSSCTGTLSLCTGTLSLCTGTLLLVYMYIIIGVSVVFFFSVLQVLTPVHVYNCLDYLITDLPHKLRLINCLIDKRRENLTRWTITRTLDMKGCICHFVEWQIHLSISRGGGDDGL